MITAEMCKERILSEDYRDFILDNIRTYSLAQIPEDELCEQEAGFGYRCVYVPSILTEPLTLKKFPYESVPKCYAPLSMEALNQTGILPIQNYPTLQLKGNGVLIGFLDGGIDYTLPVFRNLDGTTRIAAIWDQTIQTGSPPSDFVYGTEYSQEMINEALRSETPAELVPSVDDTGHGTFVASLAAGNGVPAEEFLGAAPESTLAVVKLKSAKQYLRDFYFIPEDVPCYQETDIILGIRYLHNLASRLNMPLVICITLGTNAGGHIGALPLSNLLDTYATLTNRVPVIGVGNEADKRHHHQNQILSNSESQTVEIRVGENVSGFTMELWTAIPNLLSISIVSPSGESTSPIPLRFAGETDFHFLFEGTRISIEYRILVAKTNSELIFFRISAPVEGIWKIRIVPIRIVDGTYHLWLPVTEFLSGEVFFLESSPYYTITNPGNVTRSLVVSYYDGATGGVALSSGRGYIRTDQALPDITAPGIQVQGALPDGRYAVRSGSCISTALASGAAALLLQWILHQLGNPAIDAYQIKGLFVLGAIRPAEMTFPNPEWGYGQLNLYNTFKEIRQY